MDAGRTDPVDQIRQQWAEVRPALDTAPMDVTARLSRAEAAIDAALRPLFALASLAEGDFNVLAALRRIGGAGVTPTQLADATLVTAGATTKRLDRLERQGHVTREVSTSDLRVRVVRLTERGRDLVDRLMDEHLATQARIVEGLSGEELLTLTRLLQRLEGAALEAAGPTPVTAER